MFVILLFELPQRVSKDFQSLPLTPFPFRVKLDLQMETLQRTNGSGLDIGFLVLFILKRPLLWVLINVLREITFLASTKTKQKKGKKGGGQPGSHYSAGIYFCPKKRKSTEAVNLNMGGY